MDLSWWSVDGGGTSSGGDYALSGALGQHDAGAASGDGYSVAGGQWPGAAVRTDEMRVYLPTVLRP